MSPIHLLLCLFFAYVSVLCQLPIVARPACTEGQKCTKMIYSVGFSSSVEGLCVNGICDTNTKCGGCEQKVINGRCCGNGKMNASGICTCHCNHRYDCYFQQCVGGKCVPEKPGVNCGGCQRKPINGQCCGSGVIDSARNTGLCYCGTSSQCAQKSDCKANEKCCAKGSIGLCHRIDEYEYPDCPPGSHNV
ncbi:uncharacterized protein BX664DRAFT_337297 [Halteromyces radiatus]|uniref:uncharacterized protein n=1 Tax=Halteromyces radiatus TaxID=101107 RepID=UPI0022209FBE|nr:uncharacterized protein BX664DRAFT_337297 [Halteromyces radiatus]KAI8084580.1 hypothetical protein BX664DRAFT_337297 [Halteromyces radiatus]